MGDLIDDLVKHAITRSERHLADAIALVDNERDATRLMMGYGAQTLAHLCSSFGAGNSPYPLFRGLTRAQQMHVLMSIYIRATGEDYDDLTSVQAQSDMYAAIREIMGYENRASRVAPGQHRPARRRGSKGGGSRG